MPQAVEREKHYQDFPGDEKSSLIKRMLWLVKLRWLAVLGLISTVYLSSHFLKIIIPTLYLYLVSLILAAYNLIFLIIVLKISQNQNARSSTTLVRIANLQISLDLFCLAVLIHFSGGIENPFIFYFIFHMIIASILLSRRAAFLQAALASSLLLLIIILEYLGVLAHYSLGIFLPFNLHDNIIYIGGVSFVAITTIYIAVYMATSIAGELRSREKSLKEATAYLKEKDRIKSEYVLRVSHDIKEHLSAVESCLSPVAEGITGPLGSTQKDLITSAANRAHKLTVFVNSLLEITKIRLTNKIKKEEFSLQEMLAAVKRDIEERAGRKKIKFYAQIDPSLGRMRGVRVYVEEAVLNILANAIKYTPQEGEIRLTAEDKGNRILISVSDTGIGITKEDLPFIFDEFYRSGNARNLERYGTGLGLSIVKEIVKMHKGKVWAQPQEKGSIFFIDLPK